MNAKVKIEIDGETARTLEARAAACGLALADYIAQLVGAESADLEHLRRTGRGPWAPELLAEDTRHLADFERDSVGVPWEEVSAWLKSWGTAQELAPPKPRKL